MEKSTVFIGFAPSGVLFALESANPKILRNSLANALKMDENGLTLLLKQPEGGYVRLYWRIIVRYSVKIDQKSVKIDRNSVKIDRNRSNLTENGLKTIEND
jgi:hypothetical protein